MITQRFGLMKYIPVFHPFGVALRSKSVPDGFVTKDFTKKWNNSVYSRLSKIFCGFKDQVRTRPSGEKCGLRHCCSTYASSQHAHLHVIPACPPTRHPSMFLAGIQCLSFDQSCWMPAYAGMTGIIRSPFLC
jgi:hypothetical protein